MSLFLELKRRNVLRVAIAYLAMSWLLIQVVQSLFPVFGLSDGSIRLVVVLLLIGFPLVLIFSWLYELTPDGLQLEKDVDRSGAVTHHTGKKLDRAIIVILALAIGYLAFDKFVLDPARDIALQEVAEKKGRTEALVRAYGEKSIAVLPFVNMSSDPEQEYFSDGIAEELLNVLAQIRELRVISRSSAFSFKGQNIEVPEIAERLNVAHILEGSVRKSGNRIRITAQLIEARTDTHLWSQTYDRELEDIFDIQDEIAADVVSHLRIVLLGGMPAVPRTDPVAHALTLQARAVSFSGGDDRYVQAELLLLEALDLDPNYIPALYYLSVVLYWDAAFAQPFSVVRFEENIRRGDELIERALQIDPDDAKVLTSQAWSSFEFKKDFQKAAALFERAVQLAPGDAEVLRVAAGFARRIGRTDDAIKLALQVGERDPLCGNCGHTWLMYVEAGRYEEALDARLRYSGGGVSDYTLVFASLLKGDPQAAMEYLKPGYVNESELNALRAMTLYDLGRDEEAGAALEQQVADWGEDAPETTASALAWMGKPDAAFELLYERYWPHMYGFHREVHNPIWTRLHDDSRWLELREKSGFTAEAFAAVEFNPELPEEIMRTLEE